MAADNDLTRPARDVIEPGIPATSELPRDVPPGWEGDEETPPLDVPQGVEDWGTTSREEQLGESLEQRLQREQPDTGDEAGGSVRVLEPGAEDGLVDDEADAVGELDVSGDDSPAPEETAMRVEEEPLGLTYDASPGYLDEE